jgi:hypothetical protein
MLHAYVQRFIDVMDNIEIFLGTKHVLYSFEIPMQVLHSKRTLYIGSEESSLKKSKLHPRSLNLSQSFI